MNCDFGYRFFKFWLYVKILRKVEGMSVDDPTAHDECEKICREHLAEMKARGFV